MCVFLNEGFGFGDGGEWPAVVQVVLLDRGVEVVVDEVGSRRHAQVPVEGLQEQHLHLDQVFLVQHQVQGAHEAQVVQLLQFGDSVFLLFKFAWKGQRKKKIYRVKQMQQIVLLYIMPQLDHT